MDGGALPVLVLFAPTACGKTALAENLFACDASSSSVAGTAEVVSADSVQVYKGFDVGTAKPPPPLLRRLPHHLIDIQNPSIPFGSGDFVRLADKCCLEIVRDRGRIPLVMGGTAFYIRNFMCGLPATPQAEPHIRSLLKGRLAAEGKASLHAELTKIDPVSASRIHINDEYRILRALEIWYSQGRPLSSYAVPGKLRDEYRFCAMILVRDRRTLYERIAARVEKMFEEGLPDEVIRLVLEGAAREWPAMQSIGYREFFMVDRKGFLTEKEWLDTVRSLIIKNTCWYAKRQETFCRGIPGARYFDADDFSGILEYVEQFYREIKYAA